MYNASLDRSHLARCSKLLSDRLGFSAAGFFELHRGVLTSLVGALVTYLIVLLQFKAADLQQK